MVWQVDYQVLGRVAKLAVVTQQGQETHGSSGAGSKHGRPVPSNTGALDWRNEATHFSHHGSSIITYAVPQFEAPRFQGAPQPSRGTGDCGCAAPLRRSMLTWPPPCPHVHQYPLLTYCNLYELFIFIILGIFALCCFYCK